MFLWLSGRLVAHKSIIGKGLVWIGTYSFGIYLIHPMITYVFVRWSAGFDTYPLLALCIITVLLIEIVCGFVVKAMQAWNPTAYLFGAGRWKPQVKPKAKKVKVVDEFEGAEGMPEFAAPLKMPGQDMAQELPPVGSENIQDAEVIDITDATDEEPAEKAETENVADTDESEEVVDAEVVDIAEEADADGADEVTDEVAEAAAQEEVTESAIDDGEKEDKEDK